MDLVSTARIVRRRWHVVLIGLGLTLAGVATVLAMPPTYQSTSVLVLLAPNTPPAVTPASGIVPRPVNPYQAFDGSITITAQLMSTQLTQPGVVDTLVGKGASPDYTVEPDLETGGPTVTITAKASSPEQARLTTRLVSAEFRRQLTARQTAAGAPAESLISASTVVAPTPADQLISGRIRALVAVLAVGAVLSLGMALAADAIAEARHHAQTRRGDPSRHGAAPFRDPDTERIRVGASDGG